MTAQNKYRQFVLGGGNSIPEAIQLAIRTSQSDINEGSLLAHAVQSGGGAGGALPPASQTGGTGGPSMESRVAVLEAEVKHIRVDLGKLADLPVEVATVKEKVAHLPGKGFVVTAAIGTVTALSAIIALLGRLGVLAGG